MVFFHLLLDLPSCCFLRSPSTKILNALISPILAIFPTYRNILVVTTLKTLGVPYELKFDLNPTERTQIRPKVLSKEKIRT
jgi:hypothetical protein